MNSTVVIGIGNPYRRDDGFGPAVVARLRDRRLRTGELSGIELVECDGELSELVELWEGASLAIVVDAIRTRPSRPGRVHRLSGHHPAAANATAAASTHGVGLGEAVAFAQAMDRLPQRLLVIAVEVAEVGFGYGLSAAVARAVEEVADEVVDLVGVGVG